MKFEKETTQDIHKRLKKAFPLGELVVRRFREPDDAWWGIVVGIPDDPYKRKVKWIHASKPPFMVNLPEIQNEEICNLISINLENNRSADKNILDSSLLAVNSYVCHRYRGVPHHVCVGVVLGPGYIDGETLVAWSGMYLGFPESVPTNLLLPIKEKGVQYGK